ncbi:hypothetical protein [Natronobacterium gregoryi]|uniref:Uncharacterized protein n=2 Tax=Natronobacterium gregoryi TaxID=44930 RepID=L0AL64_NATGS|nr:hypothetical protein [Natronobacterium gregoryi]AFZ73937.1 hypothetical protein Natgr_2793 [Natronobacterium gregoryi SP2]ELY71727.1 hypothetical protein C490_04802 [Natronobacterium gregoryi SP2]PLK19517.1 hypothetical protein CYV19_14320 [Natronobacterium gregoryi SP2]SFJ46940.1 hypothetical protein SAMN05443661_13211 [Natronobacterium gregoryi]
MIRNQLFRHGPAEPPGFDPSAVPNEPIDETRQVDGQEYYCRTVESPTGTWTLAFGRPTSGSESRLFRIQNGRIVDDRPVTRPTNGAIADDGTVAVVSGTDSTEIGSTLEVFGSGEPMFSRRFDATLGRPAIRPDGDLVAIATRPPASTMSLLDVFSSELRATHAVRGRTPRVLGFHGDDRYLYVGIGSGKEPYFGIDADGDVVWGCDRYQATRPLRDRVESAFETLRS